MDSETTQIYSDLLFIRALKAEMAKYRHMTRLAESNSTLMNLYTPEIKESIKKWNTLCY